MAIQYVHGKNVKLFGFKEDQYVPFACAVEVVWKLSDPLDETTTPDSVRYATFAPSRKATYSATIHMVTVLHDDVTAFWYSWEMLLEQVRNNGINLMMQFTDTAGVQKQWAFFGWIPELEMSGIVGDVSRSTITFQGSGPIDFNATVTPNPGKVTRLEWIITTPGEFSVQNNALIGVTAAKLVHVSKEGDDIYKVITAGDPTDRQVKLDNVAGTLTFLNVLEVDTFIYALISI